MRLARQIGFGLLSNFLSISMPCSRSGFLTVRYGPGAGTWCTSILALAFLVWHEGKHDGRLHSWRQVTPPQGMILNAINQAGIDMMGLGSADCPACVICGAVLIRVHADMCAC